MNKWDILRERAAEGDARAQRQLVRHALRERAEGGWDVLREAPRTVRARPPRAIERTMSGCGRGKYK